MDKFEYATLQCPGCDAWENNGRLHSAKDAFTKAANGKSVSKKGIEQALTGIEVWDWEKGEDRKVSTAVINEFYPHAGIAKGYITNRRMSSKATILIKWDPETGIVKSAPKGPSSNQEKRIEVLEKQVSELTEKVALLSRTAEILDILKRLG